MWGRIRSCRRRFGEAASDRRAGGWTGGEIVPGISRGAVVQVPEKPLAWTTTLWWKVLVMRLPRVKTRGYRWENRAAVRGGECFLLLQIRVGRGTLQEMSGSSSWTGLTTTRASVERI